MNKLSIFLTTLFTLNAYGQICEEIEFTPLYDLKVQRSITDKMFRQNKLKFVIEDVSYPTKTQEELEKKKVFMQALALIPRVLNSLEFKQKVISFKRCEKCKPGFKNSHLWSKKLKKYSPSQVYKIIMKGNEKMRPKTFGEFNYNSKTYDFGPKKTNVVGKTIPRKSYMIHHNWHITKNYTAPQLVRNIVHEWLHLLGFLHKKKKYKSSEPTYAIGKIAEEVAANIIKETKLAAR